MLSETLFREASLCVVGNINRDVKAAPIIASDRLFNDGETSVDWVAETIGGGGANSACAAAALGAQVSLLAKVGNDGLADRLARTLRSHGVTDRLTRALNVATGTSLGLSFTTGHRHFVSCLPASRSLTFTDFDLSALNGHKHLLRADVWFSESMLFEGNKLLLEAARNRGLQVSLDINWDPSWGVADQKTIAARKEAVRKILPLVNLAHGNVRELCNFADAADLDAALRSLIHWGTEAVVIHYGERGAGYFDGKDLIIEPPVLAQKQVNTTGTGDVLSVCMMLLHDSGAPARECLCLANQIVSEFIEGRRSLIPALAD
jgi:sugar/nucleoside kinase (ribokinase family)